VTTQPRLDTWAVILAGGRANLSNYISFSPQLQLDREKRRTVDGQGRFGRLRVHRLGRPDYWHGCLAGTTGDIIAGVFLASDEDFKVGYTDTAAGVTGLIKSIDLRKSRIVAEDVRPTARPQ
jgi:hypothetical protein